MVGTACTSNFTSIPLVRRSFVTGSNLISSSASVLVIVAGTFSSRSIGASLCLNARFVSNEHKLTTTKDLTTLAMGPLHCGKLLTPIMDALYLGLDLFKGPVVPARKPYQGPQGLDKHATHGRGSSAPVQLLVEEGRLLPRSLLRMS